MACLEAAARGSIEAALIMGGNLYSATPNSAWAEQALAQVPFKIYLTTTLNRGHVYGVDQTESLVLPVCARDEEQQATTQESMFNYVRLSDGGIHRHQGPRPESSILVDLATRILGSAQFDFEQFRNHASVRACIAATVPGLEALASIDVAKREFHVNGRLLHTPEFHTANGRGRFVCNPIPALESPREFMLATMRSEGQFNTLVYEDEDTYRGTETRWCVLMNPRDIETLGLNTGARAHVRSAAGCMKNVAVRPFDLPPGNVLAYFPEANCLVGTQVDPRSKTPAFKSVPVSVEPVVT